MKKIKVNILTVNGIINCEAYKTQYKNVVIVKNPKTGRYSITHYQTGTNLSTDYKVYNTLNQTKLDLEKVVNEARPKIQKNIKTLKVRCNQINNGEVWKS